MLGSDPIFQYGRVNGMYTLEPVYPAAGGSAAWTDWLLGKLVGQPPLAFAYAQAGQENSFGRDAMRVGLTYQVARLSELSKAGRVPVKTLASSGDGFRRTHPLTPPTAVVSIGDWHPHGRRRAVWYDSRFYRLNLLWDGDQLCVRDLHRFDQSVVASTHATPLATTSLTCGTLPVMDAARWSGRVRAGMFPVLPSPDARATVRLTTVGAPPVRELNPTDLSVVQPVRGGTLSVVCREAGLSMAATDAGGRPLPWALDLVGRPGQQAAVRGVTADAVTYQSDGTRYDPRLAAGSCRLLDDGTIRLTPGATGTLALRLGDDGSGPPMDLPSTRP